MSKIGVYNNKLGIGSTSPSTLVHVESDPPTGQPLLSNSIITLKNSDTGFRTEGSHSSLIHFSMGTSDNLCKIKGTHHGNTGDSDYNNKRGRVEFITHNGTTEEMLLSLVNDGDIKYLNLDSSNHGTSGYGIRDNNGTLQYKNSGGDWANITGGGGGGGTTITGAATTIDTEDLTASKALVSDANGKVAVSTVTSTELGHVSGVTSAIQTQLNGKQSTLTFEPPSSNNANPSTSAQIKTALDLKANLAGPSFTGDVTLTGSIINNNLTISSNVFTVSTGDAYFNQTGGGSTYLGNTNNDTIFNTNKVYIKGTSGDVGIGDSGPSSKLDVNGKITCTDFQNTSDRRIKENIIPATDIAIMSNIDNLNLKVYTYTEEYRKSLPEGALPNNPVFGWIAQEVKNTYSDAVVVEKNTIGETEYEDFHYIKKGKLYDLAVAGVKILHQRIKELENRIKVLEAK
tara:strand:- start:442 stop:1812 length:1371 start_codon:yes stop_codon:yes gene_type:complete